MHKIRLKKVRKRKKVKSFVITILLLGICISSLLAYVGKNVGMKILSYAESNVSKLSKIIVNHAVDDVIINQMNIEKLFQIEKNTNNDIQIIDFDPKVVNQLLSLITDNIIHYFEELETGKSSIIDLKNNLVTNTFITSKKEGVIFEIPIGIITNNAFLSNLGPRIPVRISLNGELESSIETKVENYGINNALITVYVNIKVSEQILLPINSKKVTIENNIPISIKMIQGNIPNYYFSGLTSNSNMLSLPYS